MLCVGRLEKQKAFHLAIKAFAGISEEFPNLRLKIVGMGILENDLKQEASKLNILNKIDFEGFQKYYSILFICKCNFTNIIL